MPAKPDPARTTIVLLLSLGFNLAAGMAVFSFLGYYLDQKRGGGITFTLIGVCLGLFYCGYETWKSVQSIQQGDEQNRKKESPK